MNWFTRKGSNSGNVKPPVTSSRKVATVEKTLANGLDDRSELQQPLVIVKDGTVLISTKNVDMNGRQKSKSPVKQTSSAPKVDSNLNVDLKIVNANNDAVKSSSDLNDNNSKNSTTLSATADFYYQSGPPGSLEATKLPAEQKTPPSQMADRPLSSSAGNSNVPRLRARRVSDSITGATAKAESADVQLEVTDVRRQSDITGGTGKLRKTGGTGKRGGGLLSKINEATGSGAAVRPPGSEHFESGEVDNFIGAEEKKRLRSLELVFQ